MKKQYILIISFILAFSFFLYIFLKPTNYELEYQVNDINIKESYNKDNKYYTFHVYYESLDFELISLDKYTTKRRLIVDLSIVDNCVVINNSIINLYNVCYDNNEYKIASINDDISFTENEDYENISINGLNNKKYLLWNYHSFIYLNGKKKNKINLFSKDIYNLSLNYQFDEYLLVPDYEQDYEFDKIYVINTNNGKVANISLRFPIYFDSYFLGNQDKKVYLFDIKNTQEYYIDLKKNDIYKTGNKILNNGKWEDVSTQKLKNNKNAFLNDTLIDYFIEDGSLYMKVSDSSNKLLVANKGVSKIVKQDKLDVYFLSGDTLYYFNPLEGYKALLRYSEWNFNNQNMVFIFD